MKAPPGCQYQKPLVFKPLQTASLWPGQEYWCARPLGPQPGPLPGLALTHTGGCINLAWGGLWHQFFGSPLASSPCPKPQPWLSCMPAATVTSSEETHGAGSLSLPCLPATSPLWLSHSLAGVADWSLNIFFS